MPIDAYRDQDTFVVDIDLPGVEPDSIDLNVEQNLLTVRAQRRAPGDGDIEMLMAERPHGVFSRHLFLGDTLDVDKIEAGYNAGVCAHRADPDQRAGQAPQDRDQHGQ
jgi:HSP20 family protein